MAPDKSFGIIVTCNAKLLPLDGMGNAPGTPWGFNGGIAITVQTAHLKIIKKKKKGQQIYNWIDLFFILGYLNYQHQI